MIAKKRAAAYIPGIRDRDGKLHSMPTEMANTIRAYYADLYSLDPPRGQGADTERKTRITDYLEPRIGNCLSQECKTLLQDWIKGLKEPIPQEPSS
ncbi:Hypothetical predicted protein, partial [Pelobates cultripes]